MQACVMTMSHSSSPIVVGFSGIVAAQNDIALHVFESWSGSGPLKFKIIFYYKSSRWWAYSHMQAGNCSSLDYGLCYAGDSRSIEMNSSPFDSPNINRLERAPDTTPTFGMRTRQKLSRFDMNDSPCQSQKSFLGDGSNISNPENRYNLDPFERAMISNAFIQKGSWIADSSGPTPCGLACTWKWQNGRIVDTPISQTAFSPQHDSNKQKQPSWNLHFGLLSNRPTFRRLRTPYSAHPAPASKAENMTMDPTIFSTCRVVNRASTATRNYFPAAEIQPWIPSGSGSMRQKARDRRTMSVESVARSRSSPDPNPRWTLTRSCAQLDGVNRKVITLPASWAPIATNVKSEKFAQDQVNRCSYVHLFPVPSPVTSRVVFSFQGQTLVLCIFSPRTVTHTLEGVMPVVPQATELAAAPGAPKALHAGRRQGPAVPSGQPVATPSPCVLNMQWIPSLLTYVLPPYQKPHGDPTFPTGQNPHPQTPPRTVREPTPSRLGPADAKTTC
jgi:hypothetical protein